MVQDSQVIPHGTIFPHLIYQTSLLTEKSAYYQSGNMTDSPLQEKFSWAKSPTELARYAHCICDAWESMRDIKGTPDMIDYRLESSIKVAAARAGHCQTVNPALPKTYNLKKWLDKECLEQKKKTRLTFDVAKSSHFTAVDKSVYLLEKKKLPFMQRNKEREFRRQEISALSNVKNSKDFWKVLRRYSPITYSRCPIDVRTWERFYESNYTVHHEEAEWIRLNITQMVLDKEISYEEVKSCLKALKNSKAPGPNGLPNEFYKHLPTTGIAALKILFNAVLETGCVPESWGHVKTIVLFKKGNRLDPNNYRNISLFNNITKIYTQIIATRLLNWAEIDYLLSDFQNGFRWEKGCSDNLFSLQSAIQISLRQSGRYLFAILTFAKRSIPIDDIIIALNSQNTEKDLIRARYSSYCPMYKSLLSDVNYLHFDMNWGKLKLISQIRVSSVKYAFFYWEGRVIKLNSELNCPTCQWDCPDNKHHLLGDCPASDEVRHHFRQLGSTLPEILQIETIRKADILFIFLTKILNLRIACS